MRALLALLALLLAAPPARAETPCAVPAELLDPAPLPATARALAAGALRVLVVGAASVHGPGGSSVAASYPQRLQALLRSRFPAARIEVTALGRRGLTAEGQAALVEEGLREFRPRLVVWQAGTVEAVRGLDAAEMVAVLQEGAARLRAAGVDLVLMDQQFSRFFRGNADVEPYREAVRLAAVAAGVGLLRRWEIVRAWVEAEAVDVERAPPEAQTAEVDRLNNCLAGALRDHVARGAALSER